MRTVIRNGTIIDGTGAPPAVGDVVVEDGRIIQVGVDLDGDTAVDVTGRWLLPGLIDTHVHVMVDDFTREEALESPFSLGFFRAVRNLDRTLRAGVTTVRDTGGADLGVRTAVERGLISGPRMRIAVNLLSTTGGHADHWDVSGFALPDLIEHPGRPDGVCDGPVGVMTTSRRMLRAGADFIKICATGGVLSPTDEPAQPGFTLDEMRAAVGIAEDHGTYVAAHAHGGPGLKAAIRAGVRTIEHGSILDDEAISLMLQHDVTLVPTLSAARWISQSERYPAAQREQAAALIDTQDRSVKLAAEAGVRIAFGSDAGVCPHGANLTELSLLVGCGLTPMEALVAATRDAAGAIGASDDLGTIREGKRADLVVLARDPLQQIDALGQPGAVESVWLDGVCVHQAADEPPATAW